MGRFRHSGPHLELLRGVSFSPTESCDAAVAAEEWGVTPGGVGASPCILDPGPWGRRAGRAFGLHLYLTSFFVEFIFFLP